MILIPQQYLFKIKIFYKDNYIKPDIKNSQFKTRTILHAKSNFENF